AHIPELPAGRARLGRLSPRPRKQVGQSHQQLSTAVVAPPVDIRPPIAEAAAVSAYQPIVAQVFQWLLSCPSPEARQSLLRLESALLIVTGSKFRPAFQPSHRIQP